MCRSLLASPKILVNLPDRSGQTPLIWAAKLTSDMSDLLSINTDTIIIKLLLDTPKYVRPKSTVIMLTFDVASASICRIPLEIAL